MAALEDPRRLAAVSTLDGQLPARRCANTVLKAFHWMVWTHLQQ